MRIAITGASGFIGSALVRRALEEGHAVLAFVRRKTDGLPAAVEVVETGDLLGQGLPRAAVQGCDALVNCAARVHIRRETERDPEAAFHLANSQLPAELLEVAAEAGVSRFVQVSSVAAVASRTPPGVIVDDSFAAQPQTAYGRSKLDGDLVLGRFGGGSGVSVVSLRPPTVFGPGVGAYFRMLMHCAKLGVPLPIGGIQNRRSFVFLDNLADALLCAAAARHEGRYIVTDSHPVSTAELYRVLLHEYGRRALVPKLPASLARFLGLLVLGDRVESLVGNAAYDGSRFRRDFGWSPKTDYSTAIALTVGIS